MFYRSLAWLAHQLIDWLVYLPIDCSTDWSNKWLIDWLTEGLTYSSTGPGNSWWIDWLIDWSLTISVNKHLPDWSWKEVTRPWRKGWPAGGIRRRGPAKGRDSAGPAAAPRWPHCASAGVDTRCTRCSSSSVPQHPPRQSHSRPPLVWPEGKRRKNNMGVSGYGMGYYYMKFQRAFSFPPVNLSSFSLTENKKGACGSRPALMTSVGRSVSERAPHRHPLCRQTRKTTPHSALRALVFLLSGKSRPKQRKRIENRPLK